MRILPNPNLPDFDVTAVAISYNAKKAIDSLRKQEIACITVKKNPFITDSTATHPDMQIFQLKDKIFCTNSEHLFRSSNLKKYYSIVQTNDTIQSPYPNDVALNGVTVGKYLICNPKTFSKSILKTAEQSGQTVIPVNQGYAKCSVCVLNESAVITDDKSIYASVQRFINDVTYIEKGSVRLEGFPYGFIGGCTGLIAPNRLAINGQIESHQNHNEILDALSRNHITPMELTTEPLEDIGSILPLLQE